MRLSKECEIAGRKVSIVEMTLGEIRAWLKAITSTSAEPDGVVDALLFEGFDPDALTRMTNLGKQDLNELTPSDLRKLADACREVNSDFFVMRQRMAEAQRNLLSAMSSVPR